jgi:hypothetical protein
MLPLRPWSPTHRALPFKEETRHPSPSNGACTHRVPHHRRRPQPTACQVIAEEVMSLMFLASSSHLRLLAMTYIACCTILLPIRHLPIRHSPSHTHLHFASILLSTCSDLSSFAEGPMVNHSRLQASAAQRNVPPLAEAPEAPLLPLKLFSLGSADLLNSATKSPRKPAVALRQLCRAQSRFFRVEFIGYTDLPSRLATQACYALLRMRPLSIPCAECSVVISCGKVDYDKSG